MKALVSEAPGGPETLVLRNMPEPQPGPGEVLVSVKACGVNFPDFLIIQDKYQFRPPRPFAPGAEIAGIVERVGDGVAGFRPGDRVIGSLLAGGMAEKAVVSAARCLAMPASMPFDEASAFVLTYGTSYHGLKNRAALKPGETLLVLGAAGGVGVAAVELGKAMGARVVAAVSSDEKLALAKKHGADSGFVYGPAPNSKEESKALADGFKAALGEGGANVIYDPVGGDYAEPALRAIAWEGRYLVVGFPAGIPRLPLNLTLLKSCQIVGVFWGEFARRDPAGNAENNRELLELYASGTIRPYVSEHFPLERGAEAIQKLASRSATGKLVVTIGEG
jgi:NADPH2:quinone reductase